MRPNDVHVPDAGERLPAFTVATALAWLGHDHCRTCPDQVHARADAWLVSPTPEGRPSGLRALVDISFVNPPWPRADGYGIVAQINVCTCRDRIQVTLRNDLGLAAAGVPGSTADVDRAARNAR